MYNRTLRKWLLSGSGIALALGLFIGSVLVVDNTLGGWRIDLTENRLFTLSEGTRQILAGLQEPITLDFYYSRRQLLDYPQLTNYGARVQDMLKEYASLASGRLELNILDPAPFSELEEQAIAVGMQALGDNAGQRAWFGLVGSNTTDDEKIIPFFHTRREGAVEYDISKLIQQLSKPRTPRIGVLSELPVFADPRHGDQEWTLISALREFFDLRALDRKTTRIDADLDGLLIIHPKTLSDSTLHALDQYLLGGGKAMIFIDPLAEQDPAARPDADSKILPRLDSSLGPLLDAWGLAMDPERVVTDLNAAMRVQARGPAGPIQTTYLPWLRLGAAHCNQQDLVTSQLNLLHLGTAGHLEKTTDSGPDITPLLQTSSEAMLLSRDLILFQPDPNVILNNFRSAGRRFTLAARVQGRVQGAFPEPPDVSPTDDWQQDRLEEGIVDVIVVADSDILADHFWTRPQTIMGRSVPQAIANNSDFVINALESLLGGGALARLRTREKYSRPFLRVEALRKGAERRLREREQQLQEKLQQTEEKLRTLQEQTEAGQQALFDPAQSAEFRKFQQQALQTRRQLRAVQHELREDIERLGARIRFINILLIPLLIFLGGLVFGLRQLFIRPSPAPGRDHA